jgi:6-pyruvoyltetrahydropterin/6-carboxytetrahydropterin synthase
VYELKVITQFAAAHSLRNFRGKCEDLHGHNWKIEIFVQADRLDETELVMDFGEIKKETAAVLEDLDHTHLNQLEFFKTHNPSSENIARYIYERLAPRIQRGRSILTRVSAWESDTSCASYVPDL